MKYFPWLFILRQMAFPIGRYLFTLEILSKKSFTIWTATRRETHKSKKDQHVDLLTSTFSEYKPKLGDIGKPLWRAGVEYQRCQFGRLCHINIDYLKYWSQGIIGPLDPQGGKKIGVL